MRRVIRFWALMPVYCGLLLFCKLSRRSIPNTYDYEESASFRTVNLGVILWDAIFIAFFGRNWILFSFLFGFTTAVFFYAIWDDNKKVRELRQLQKRVWPEIERKMQASPHIYWSVGRMWTELRSQHYISDRVTIRDVRELMVRRLGSGLTDVGPWRWCDVQTITLRTRSS